MRLGAHRRQRGAERGRDVPEPREPYPELRVQRHGARAHRRHRPPGLEHRHVAPDLAPEPEPVLSGADPRTLLPAAHDLALHHEHLPRVGAEGQERLDVPPRLPAERGDRKSTRLNSSHPSISYAVFCLKKKNKTTKHLIKETKKRKVMHTKP